MGLTLVVMAAGLGSRYGGLKQIDPVGPNDEIIMEYSIYDAIIAGFDHVVFVIKHSFSEEFKEKHGNKIAKKVKVSYAYQDEPNLPIAIEGSEDREKPWGTAHAVYICKDIVNEPFAVINADDFYGRDTFLRLAEHLSDIAKNKAKNNYCMVGFSLKNTLTESGYVSRGVCKTDDSGKLIEIIERTNIVKNGDNAKYSVDNGESYIKLSGNTIVSMNAWGFSESFFGEIKRFFPKFVEENKNNLLKAEYYLPSVVDYLLKEGSVTVDVMPCNERWFGVTYKEDKEVVVREIARLVSEGCYPHTL